MAFYLIGTGMNKNSISADALEILKTCDKIYLENYTVNFPYSTRELEETYNLKIQELDRQKVEDESILKKAKNTDVALLVYGDALSATTHMQLILEAKKQKIPYRIFHNASILTTIAETGLSLYKFGKTASMPNWAEHTNKPTSFIDYVKENQSINAHTLILTDIGLEISSAIEQLLESVKGMKLPEKIVAISNAGTPKQKIFYDSPENLACTEHRESVPRPTDQRSIRPSERRIEMPFCLIIPAKLHFLEEKALKEFGE